VGTTAQEQSLNRGLFFALGAAALFGLSTPLAKRLVGSIEPALLAGLLYLGSAVGLSLWLLARRFGGARLREAPLRRGDLGWLTGATLSGGALGPLLLMMGLKRITGVAASLLLNMEALLTIGLAWLIFREHFDRRMAIGAGLIIAGGIVLSFNGEQGVFRWDGLLLILGACLAWGIDNNLTRQISGGDPIQIAVIKGFIGGSVNVVFVARSNPLELGGDQLIAAGLLGLAGYGVSLVLFILALRHIGAARTGAAFATAPFIGGVVSIFLLEERISAQLLLAAGFMGAGVWLQLSERHSHEHLHEAQDHNHAHIHDLHHQHTHDRETADGEAHSHSHRHDPQKHSHPHFPDLHHQHSH